ncbi:hypothetical protein BH10BAC6_BH10BAC6_03960 [soil metagenome]
MMHEYIAMPPYHHLLILVSAAILRTHDTTDVIDHSSFDSLWHASLKNGRLSTDAVKYSTFDIYWRRLRSAEPATYSRAARTAFWSNAWLASILSVMAAHAGYRSTIWSDELFDADTFTIAHEEFTLRTLRTRVVHESGSPMALFALATGSTRGPPFPAHAYTARTVERMLRELARRVCRSERFVFYDPGSNVLQISSVFAELEPAIVTTYGSMIQFLLPYVSEAVAADVALRRSSLKVIYGDAVERWLRRR